MTALGLGDEVTRAAFLVVGVFVFFLGLDRSLRPAARVGLVFFVFDLAVLDLAFRALSFRGLDFFDFFLIAIVLS
jgi:hypothetical protein